MKNINFNRKLWASFGTAHIFLKFGKYKGFKNYFRSRKMNYEKMSRAMRYHYGSGHLAMVKEKRLFYRF